MITSEVGLPRTRTLTGPAGWVQYGLLLLIPVLGLFFVLNLHVRIGLRVYSQQWVALFLTLCLVSTFLTIPAGRRAPRARLPWYDALFCLAALPAGLWITIYYPSAALRLGAASNERLLVGGLAVILILEAVRRTIGLPLMIVALTFVLYGRFSSVLPGVLAGPPLSWSRLVNYLYLDPNSFLFLVGLAATYGLAFVFFGQALLVFGGAQNLTNLALLAFGRVRGGPAKVAVVGSSLVGTVTGGPVTNVFLTGSLTIPMMIRSGQSPRMAAAVESVASTGGQIMPPVMGIAAFIIAETLGVPYAEVALAALLPAVLYYLAFFIQVDLEAGKLGLRGLRRSELPAARRVLLQCGPVLLIIAILLYVLFAMGLFPATAGAVAGLVAIPILALQQGQWRQLGGRLLQVLRDSGQLVLDVTAALAAAGLVVGVIAVSGLGFTFGYFLTQLGEQSLFLLLVAAALGSLVLGMGMPSVAAYALVAVMVAPAITEFGVPPMAAHLFIFYFAIISNFTPPVAVAAFAAATLAGTDPMRTGFTAMRLGVLAYIIPFLFVWSPTLLLQGEPLLVVLSAVTAILGTFVLGVALTGYLARPVSRARRLPCLAAGLLLLIPLEGLGPLALANLAGLALAALVLWPDFRQWTATRSQEEVA